MEKVENDDERELAALETTVHTLRSLKSVWDHAQSLKLKEIPALKKQLEELQEQRSSAIESLESVSIFSRIHPQVSKYYRSMLTQMLP